MSENSVAVNKTSSGKSDSSLVSRIAFGVLGLFLIGIVLLYAVLYFGSVSGEEFSPDSFHRRRFAYLELPLIGAQLTPIRHTDTTGDLENYLAVQKLFPKPTEPKNRWHLVSASRGTRGHAQGDAGILCQYLDAINKDRDSIWLKWSEDHVEMAKVLWPAVADVARHELYSFVPELFVLARSVSTPDQLQQSIDQALADKYLLVAETLEALEQNDVAAELFAEVLRHAPDRAEAIQGRDKSVNPDSKGLSSEESSQSGNSDET